LSVNTVTLPVTRASGAKEDEGFLEAKKDRAKPGPKVINVAPEYLAAINVAQVLSKCHNIFTLTLGTGYKNFVFHKSLPAGLPITST
jgi:hypothetical protein